MFRLRSAFAVLLLASSASHAATCESIRAQIDAKVRASGVSNFTLSTLDADAKTAGKVVGTCDLGSKKIVYLQGGQGSASAPAPAAPKRAQEKPKEQAKERILTECKDGSVSVGGDCRK